LYWFLFNVLCVIISTILSWRTICIQNSCWHVLMNIQMFYLDFHVKRILYGRDLKYLPHNKPPTTTPCDGGTPFFQVNRKSLFVHFVIVQSNLIPLLDDIEVSAITKKTSLYQVFQEGPNMITNISYRCIYLRVMKRSVHHNYVT